MVAMVAVVVRALQLTMWPVVEVTSRGAGIRWWPMAVAVVVLQGGWTACWCRRVVLAQTIPLRLCLPDTVIAAIALIAAGLACVPGQGTTWADSAVTPALGAAATVAVAWYWPKIVAAEGILVVAYGCGIGAGLISHGGSHAWSSAITNIALLGLVAPGIGLATRWVLGQARDRDRLESEITRMRSLLEREADQAAERARQYRMLHDTVLSTLATLARGGIDANDPAVRRRCAADADYLRSVIADGSGSRLRGALATVARSQAALGLRVHLHCDHVSADLPGPVIGALVAATREALNNVLAHAGVDQAWVTVLSTGAGEISGITVTITDRGRGFDPARTGGSGIAESIRARIHAVGGTARIDSAPGQGAMVTLTWEPPR
jgi:signal transduction histidine kinase